MTTSCATSNPDWSDRAGGAAGRPRAARFAAVPAAIGRRVGPLLFGLVLLLAPAELRAQGDGHGHAQAPEPPAHADSMAAAADSLALPESMPEPGPPTIYVDLDRNLARLRSPEAVAALVDTVARAGFRRIIVDVKTRDGRVLYPSRVAPRLELEFDYFETFRREARRRNVQVGALFSVFAEGDPRTKTGPVYDHPEWQTTYRTADGQLANQAETPTIATVYANPVLFNVQRYEAMSFSDLLSALKPDFICIDEARFFNNMSDLGDSTRASFDAWFNLSPSEWPDVAINQQHPRFSWWVAFRVGVIHEFVARLKRLRDTVAPGTPLVLMAPAYYEPAATIGVNWAHSSYRPPFWYANSEFRKRALADLVDELVLVSRDANPKALHEIGLVVRNVTRRQRPASVFLPVDVFQRRHGRMIEGVGMVREAGLGLVVGDAGQVGGFELWPLLEELLVQP
jgi:hypothetical protein